MLITCEECTAQVEAASAMAIRPAGGDVLEHGLVCPNCSHWVHAYFMTPTLATLRQRLEGLKVAIDARKTRGAWQNYATARDAYKRQFEATQRRLERKRGLR